jgi:hypothetical protein
MALVQRATKAYKSINKFFKWSDTPTGFQISGTGTRDHFDEEQDGINFNRLKSNTQHVVGLTRWHSQIQQISG